MPTHDSPGRTRRRVLVALLAFAVLGHAHWFFGNLYEAVVLIPQFAAAPEQRLPISAGGVLVPGSPALYYVPRLPLTVPAALAALALGWPLRAGGARRAPRRCCPLGKRRAGRRLHHHPAQLPPVFRSEHGRSPSRSPAPALGHPELRAGGSGGRYPRPAIAGTRLRNADRSASERTGRGSRAAHLAFSSARDLAHCS